MNNNIELLLCVIYYTMHFSCSCTLLTLYNILKIVIRNRFVPEKLKTAGVQHAIAEG